MSQNKVQVKLLQSINEIFRKDHLSSIDIKVLLDSITQYYNNAGEGLLRDVAWFDSHCLNSNIELEVDSQKGKIYFSLKYHKILLDYASNTDGIYILCRHAIQLARKKQLNKKALDTYMQVTNLYLFGFEPPAYLEEEYKEFETFAENSLIQEIETS